MTDEQFRRKLEEEGFETLYVWEDGPDAFYSDHKHLGDSAHIILDGEMKLTMQGGCGTYRAGDRVDIPAGVAHSATIGPNGCRYLIGEKPERSLRDRAVEQFDNMNNVQTGAVQSRTGAKLQ